MELNQNHNGKPRIAYGAGNALLGLLAEEPEIFDWVVDDTPGYAGQKIAGLQIYPSAKAFEMPPGSMEIVICAQTSTAAAAMAAKLRQRGFVEGSDFLDGSHLQINRMANRLCKFLGRAPNDLLKDQVRAAVDTVRLRNLSGAAGTWAFVALIEAVCQADEVPGAIAECGVYQGANAIAALKCCPALRQRRYCLFDSFEGLRSLSLVDPASRVGEFSDVSLSNLKESLAPFKNCELQPGYFEQTLPHLSNTQWAMIYIDCDLANPARFCAEYFWDRMPIGALLLVHDYWYSTAESPSGFPEPFSGIKVVMDKFLSDRNHAALVLPETSHLVVRKL